MIFFNKIKETVAALTYKPSIPLPHELVENYRGQLHRSVAGEVAERAVRFGVLIAVVIPTAYLLTEMLHKLTSWSAQRLGTVGMLVGIALGLAISKLDLSSFLDKVPFHKLNPYFGSKIEETFAAFSKKYEQPK